MVEFHNMVHSNILLETLHIHHDVSKKLKLKIVNKFVSITQTIILQDIKYLKIVNLKIPQLIQFLLLFDNTDMVFFGKNKFLGDVLLLVVDNAHCIQ